MKTLYLLRHGKSSWADDSLTDHDRPLKRRGQEDAERMGLLLADRDEVPDLVWSSSAVRALQTARRIANSAGVESDVHVNPELYGADPETILVVAAQCPDWAASVAIVGHNPGLSELVDELTGELVDLPTCALARIDVPIESWDELVDPPDGRLRWVLRPKELGWR